MLIATEAATINPADLAIVTATAASRFPPEAVAPYIPGWDLVGQVVGSGDGVDNTMKGARVVGFTNWFTTGRGTQASVVALPATNVVIAPDGLPSTELTTVGVNGLTAQRGLADLNLRAGGTLVITGAAGGVGGFATELAVVRGLTVIAAVREDAHGDAHALGAHARWPEWETRNSAPSHAGSSRMEPTPCRGATADTKWASTTARSCWPSRSSSPPESTTTGCPWTGSPSSKASASTTRPPRPRPTPAAAGRWPSSAAATPPGRPRSS